MTGHDDTSFPWAEKPHATVTAEMSPPTHTPATIYISSLGKVTPILFGYSCRHVILEHSCSTYEALLIVFTGYLNYLL